MVPEVLLLPLVVLATAATVIASQAVITGAFSLVRQGVQLGLLPRFEVRYTSETHAGQIYLPRVNRAAADRRAAAGAAVPHLERARIGLRHRGLHHHGVRRHHGLRRDLETLELERAATAAALIVPFVVVDMTFFAANLLKLLEGAWVPLLFGAVVVVLIWTWRRGASDPGQPRRAGSRCRSPI